MANHNPGLSPIRFTKRELACITQVMQGKSISKVAEDLGLKRHSVYFYLKNACRKLDVWANASIEPADIAST